MLGGTTCLPFVSRFLLRHMAQKLLRTTLNPQALEMFSNDWHKFGGLASETYHYEPQNFEVYTLMNQLSNVNVFFMQKVSFPVKRVWSRVSFSAFSTAEKRFTPLRKCFWLFQSLSLWVELTTPFILDLLRPKGTLYWPVRLSEHVNQKNKIK